MVVHRFDRLARSLIGYIRLLEEFRKHRVSLFIVTAPELGSTAHDHLIFNILASFAEFEREMIASRIADARAALKAKGRRVAGAVPYGYDGDPRTKQLVVNPKEALAVRWMFGAAAEGKLPLVIAKEANARGWLTKAGGLWTARQVIATLRNPVHLGLFRDGGSARSGNHEPIIEKQLFDTAAERLESRRTRQPGNRLAIEWPLKGLLQCAACGRGMSPHTIRKGPRVYRYYRCRSTAGGQPPCGNQVSAYAIERAVQGKLSKRTGANVDLNETGKHVESVTYDASTGMIEATLIVTETATADSERSRNPGDCSSPEERPTPAPSRQSRRPVD